eukprot:m.28581 g.28581  ORF g.28581 m.28581 type:complete len:798 (-) comp9052_c0_seq3:2918-5311(-)
MAAQGSTTQGATLDTPPIEPHAGSDAASGKTSTAGSLTAITTSRSPQKRKKLGFFFREKRLGDELLGERKAKPATPERRGSLLSLFKRGGKSPKPQVQLVSGTSTPTSTGHKTKAPKIKSKRKPSGQEASKAQAVEEQAAASAAVLAQAHVGGHEIKTPLSSDYAITSVMKSVKPVRDGLKTSIRVRPKLSRPPSMDVEQAHAWRCTLDAKAKRTLRKVSSYEDLGTPASTPLLPFDGGCTFSFSTGVETPEPDPIGEPRRFELGDASSSAELTSATTKGASDYDAADDVHATPTTTTPTTTTPTTVPRSSTTPTTTATSGATTTNEDEAHIAVTSPATKARVRSPLSEERAVAATWFRHSWPPYQQLEEPNVIGREHGIFRMADLEMGKVLGQGFYGKVLQCRNKFTGELLVVKELIRSDPEAQAGFVAEMNLLKSLNHPNVLKFIGLFFRDKTINLVTEFIGNGTLQSHILSKEEFPWVLRLRMAHDVASGMQYLHEQRILHRDLKSENCLVRNDMSVVVCDFGLARVMNGEVFRRESNASALQLSKSVRLNTRSPHRSTPVHMQQVGTPDWMAPEIIFGKDYNEMVDVFSFAVLLCSLIARMEPDPDLIRSQSFGIDEKKFRTFAPAQCPEGLLRLTFQCACCTPDERPSFTELMADLYVLELRVAASDIAELAKQDEVSTSPSSDITDASPAITTLTASTTIVTTPDMAEADARVSAAGTVDASTTTADDDGYVQSEPDAFMDDDVSATLQHMHSLVHSIDEDETFPREVPTSAVQTTVGCDTDLNTTGTKAS